MSKMICKQCYMRIEDWYDFKKSCDESQFKLQTWINTNERAALYVCIFGGVFSARVCRLLVFVSLQNVQVKEEPFEIDGMQIESTVSFFV